MMTDTMAKGGVLAAGRTFLPRSARPDEVFTPE